MAVHYFTRCDLHPVADFPTDFWDRAISSAGAGLMGLTTSATYTDQNRILWFGPFEQDVDIAVKYRPLAKTILNSGNSTTDAGLQIWARCTTKFTNRAAAGSYGLCMPLSANVQSSKRVQQTLNGTVSDLLGASTAGNMSSADMAGPFGKWFRVRLNGSNFQRESWLSSGSPTALSTAASFSQNSALDTGSYVGVSYASQGVCAIYDVCIATAGDTPVYTPPSATHRISGILRDPSPAVVGAGYTVKIYHRPTKKLWADVLTDGSGAWSSDIPAQFASDEFYAFGVDTAGTWASPIKDRIIPSEI